MQRLFKPIATAAAVAAAAWPTLGAAQEQVSRVHAETSPIRKVVILIEDMKAQAEKDAEEDLKVHDKYMCWCETNEKQKTEAIEEAKAHIEELTAFLEGAAAKEDELKARIESLGEDIAEDKDALETATAQRAKENEEFAAEEADMKETRALLEEAVKVLSKVQLVQKGRAVPQEAQAMLLQVREKVARYPKFRGLMQRDLYDIFGALEGVMHRSGGDAFLPPRVALDQEKPNELEGAAAGAKSYNSRSGGILGMLKQMQDQFAADLAEAQKAEFAAEVGFQKLRAAKLGEIQVATEQKEQAEQDLADLLKKVASSKKDLEATQAAIVADEEFLANMRKDCEHEHAEYKKRSEVRGQEIVAISETLKILTEDDARDLFSKTNSFLQEGSMAQRAAAQDRAAQRAMMRIARVARKHNNWALVSLAVRARLDAFTKVKKAMDQMMAELTKQQKDEYAKMESCKKEIDETEDSIKVGEQKKKDLDEKHLSLMNEIETLKTAIAELNKEISEMQVSLKQAGEDRKAQNQLFQGSVADQRAVTNILNKALDRLKQFYAPGEAALVEVGAHDPNEAGKAVAPEPKKGQAYQKSAGAGGVVQLLMKVIADSEIEATELVVAEQEAQKDYAEFTRVTASTIEADRKAIEEKTGRLAEVEAERSETEQAQLTNDEDLGKLGDLLKAHHVECDYVMKYFDIRQKARAEEIDAITDAKAVLSGANFGK